MHEIEHILSDVPTVAESVIPNFDVSGWYGIFAPARTPRNIVIRLNDEIVKILRTSEFSERLSTEGAEVGGNSPEEFGAYIKSEIARWKEIIRLSGVKPE